MARFGVRRFELSRHLFEPVREALERLAGKLRCHPAADAGSLLSESVPGPVERCMAVAARLAEFIQQDGLDIEFPKSAQSASHLPQAPAQVFTQARIKLQ